MKTCTQTAVAHPPLSAETGPRDAALLCAMQRIRLRGYRRVLWQRHLWEHTAQTPAQGLAIPHEEADIACLALDNRRDEAAFYQSNPTAGQLSARIAELETAPEDNGGGRLGVLTALFSLSPAEIDFLILCVAPEFDPRLRRLYGYLHDDAAYCAPTLWLAQVVFAWDASVRFTPDTALLRWLLAYPKPNEEEPWHSMACWTVDPRITGYLSGREDIAPSLHAGARWVRGDSVLAYEPAAVATLRRLIEGADIGMPRLAQLVGAEGVGRKAWAARVCAERGRELLCLDAPRLLGGPNSRECLVRAEREALLHDCGLYWEHADKIPPDVWGGALFLAPVQLFGVERPITLSSHAPYAEVLPFALPTPAQALALWRQVLSQGRGDFGDTALAERFTLTPAEIHQVATKAGEGRGALWAACRDLSRGRLQGLATLLPCPFTWEDIILPADTMTHLHDIASQVAHRAVVYEHWGFGQKRPLGRGVSVLFAGASGTGKTMAAQVLAAEMGLVLFRIDLASVVSKYIGETEKNLRQIFDEAERLNAVLFFDEADALFGKRTEVKDAHDRYANIEVNYLLQRMEAYEGLAILATNRKGDIDSAFLRRLRFIVDFPMPDIPERAAIWRLALPEGSPDGTPLLDEIAWDFLAARLEITGASIKDIALGAAFLACAEGTKISMKHVLRAARRNLMKHGRLVGRGEFGEYSDV
jgi:ATPase family protein associated with various cellular activities (AAA)/winged helix domain-containing protein